MNFVIKYLRYVAIALVFAFCFSAIFYSLVKNDDESFLIQPINSANVFENQLYDYKVKRSLSKTFIDPNIVLVKIDDYSLQKIGTWPIPRRNHSKLIRNLKHFGAKVIALDILFPEKAPVCGSDEPDKDLANAFTEFCTDGSVIISYSVSDNEQENMTDKELPEDLVFYGVDSQVSADNNLKKYYPSKFNFPISEFTNLDLGLKLGHIASEEDSDGIFRRHKIIANISDNLVVTGSLGLLAFELFDERVKFFAESDGINKLKFIHKKTKKADGSEEVIYHKETLRVEPDGTIKIRFVGGTSNFETIPFYDVIDAKDDDPNISKLLKGKIVFVGSTATGAHDLRATPIDAKLPGVYTHMNVTHMLLNKYFFKPEFESVSYSLIFLFLGTLILILVQLRGNALLDIILVLSLMGVSFFIDEKYFMPQGYEIKLFFCYLCFMFTYSWNTSLNFIKTSAEKKQIKGTFSRYVSPAIVKDMLDNPDKLKIGGDKKDITCFFSDVRDFTSISENMTAVELSNAMNTYMSAMTNIVFEYKGTLDKYIGDAIVAIWNAPVDIENHPQLAVEAAIKMMEVLPKVNEDFKLKGWPEFRVGAGLNSGEVSVGNMGSDKIFSYTALGDNMNLGARLEGLSKNYGVSIVISEFTHKRIDHTKIKTRILDRVAVKGKEIPVTIYEVLHPSQKMYQDDASLQLYKEAYQLFLDKKLSESLEMFQRILSSHEHDKASMRIVELIKSYLESGLPSWHDHDVTIMKTK